MAHPRNKRERKLIAERKAEPIFNDCFRPLSGEHDEYRLAVEFGKLRNTRNHCVLPDEDNDQADRKHLTRRDLRSRVEAREYGARI